jgi:hypothetical protein
MLAENGSTMRQYISSSYSVRKAVLHNIFIALEVIKTCFNETYSKVRIGKQLSGSFLIQNSLKQRAALSPVLFNFASEYSIGKV